VKTSIEPPWNLKSLWARHIFPRAKKGGRSEAEMLHFVQHASKLSWKCKDKKSRHTIKLKLLRKLSIHNILRRQALMNWHKKIGKCFFK
jgi:hypothetical protein